MSERKDIDEKKRVNLRKDLIWNTVFMKKYFSKYFLQIGERLQGLNCLHKQIRSVRQSDVGQIWLSY